MSSPPNPTNAEAEEQAPKSESLRIGDIILVGFSNAEYNGFLSSDGIISSTLDLIPRDSSLVKGANVLTRSCLFRIENARRVSHKSLSKLQSSKQEKAETELRMALGKSLTYGERIQLRHVHSSGFVSIDHTNIASEGGCLSVRVGPEGTESSWFEIVPINKLRKDGEVILYSDPVCLQSSTDRSKYFLHCYKESIVSPDSKVEVNASGNTTNWHLRRYMPYQLFTEAPPFVTTGDSFKIFHRISEGYLAVQRTDFLDDLPASIPVFVGKRHHGANSLWELQRSEMFLGGSALWSEFFRIKHVATGYFLKQDGKNAILVPEADQAGTIFKLDPDAEISEPEIRFNTILTIQSDQESFLEAPELKKSHIPIMEEKNKPQFPVSFTSDKKAYASLAFMIVDVPEEQTAHIYKLALALPHMTYIYGLLQRIEQPTIKTEKHEVEGRTNKNCKDLNGFVNNLRAEIITSQNSKVDIRQRQKSMEEMGILNGLIRILDAISHNLRKLMPLEDETFACIQALEDVQNNIYQLIYECARGNPHICDNLQSYDAQLLQLHGHKSNPNIGKILREIFKYTNRASTVSRDKIQHWFDSVRPVSSHDNNFEDQILYLKILSYLCEHEGKGVLKYQLLVLNELLNPTKAFTILKLDADCIVFDYSPHLHADFLQKNPELASLRITQESLVQLDDHPKVHIRYSNLSQLPRPYIKYLAAALDLFANVCLDRNNLAINQLSLHIGIKPDKLLIGIRCEVCPPKVKAGLIKLLSVLYVDTDPYIKISDHQSLCFQWENGFRRDLTLKEKDPEITAACIDLVFEFWQRPPSSEHELIDSLKLLGSYVTLTRLLIDLDILDLNEVMRISIFLNSVITRENSLADSWTALLLRNAKQVAEREKNAVLENKLLTVTAEIVESFHIVLLRKKAFQAEQLSSVYKTWRESEGDYDELGLIMTPVIPIEEVTQILNNPASLIDQEMSVDSLKSVNIQLLDLLFEVNRAGKKQLRDKVLGVVLHNLIEKKELWLALNEIEFITEPNLNQTYDKFSEKKSQLYDYLKVLSQFQEENIEIKGNMAYADSLKHSVSTVLDLESLIQVKATDVYRTEKIQHLMRHSGVYIVLMKVLLLNFNDSLRLLFRHTLKVLYIFCLRNKNNQDLLFSYIKRVIELIGHGCGATKLLAEILSKHKRSSVTQEILDYIFHLIEERQGQFQLFSLLQTFVYDEEGQLIPEMQVNILKHIFSCNAVKELYPNGNFLNPNINAERINKAVKQREKLHVACIKCIIACSRINKFSILQGRKVIAFNNLKKAIKNHELNSHFKKAYLRYLFEVFMVEVSTLTEPPISLNGVNDIISEVIIKELEHYQPFLTALIPLARHGLYENVSVKASSFSTFAVFKNIISRAKIDDLGSVDELLKEKKTLADTDVELTANDLKTLEFWRYLSGHHKWYSEKDGMLHVLIDMFKANKDILTVSTRNTLDRLQRILEEISNALEDAELRNPDLDFSSILMLVNYCISEIPRDNPSRNELNILIVALREHIITNRLSLEDVFKMFDLDGSGNIDLKEFTDTVSLMLQNISEEQIRDAFSNLDVNKDGSVAFSEFSKQIRSQFEKPREDFVSSFVFSKRIQQSGELDGDKLIREEFRNEFLMTVKPILQNSQLNILTNSLCERYLKSPINQDAIKEFVSNMSLAFGKNNKLYLIRLFHSLFNSPNEILQLQTALSEAGAIEIALSAFQDDQQPVLYVKTVRFMLSLLTNGPKTVQNKFLHLLKNTENSFFAYIRNHLRLARDRIVDQTLIGAAEDSKAKTHTLELLKLVQLCTENCNANFQNFLRTQEDISAKKRPLSINLVGEIAQFLINIKELRSNILNTSEARLLIHQCFKTLIDMCRGPCTANQEILGTRRKLYQFIKVIYDIKDPGGKYPLFLAKSVKFLLALIEGKLQNNVAEMMLEEIEFEVLSQFAIEIYKDFIHGNIDTVIQEWVQDAPIDNSLVNSIINMSRWISSKLEHGGLPKAIWSMINTGFNIVIVLFKLKEEFPNRTELTSLGFSYTTISQGHRGMVSKIKYLGGRQESFSTDIKIYCKRKRPPKVISEEEMKDLAYEFYLSLISTVEIDKDDNLELCYFKVPSMITFFSANARKELLNSINRNSQEEKTKSFFKLAEKYQVHMRHLQLVNRLGWLAWWASKNNVIGEFSFIIIVTINILLVSSLGYDADFEIALLLLGCVLIFCSLISYLFFIIENYPLIIYDKQHASQNIDLYSKPALSKLKGTILMRDYVDVVTEEKGDENHINPYVKLSIVLLNLESIYNIFYIILALMGIMWNYICYSILLLDILRRSEDLQNVSKAITQNKLQLGLTVILGLIIVYLFGIVGFLWLGEYYGSTEEDAPMNTYCESLFECVVTTLTIGIRSGGGIGESLLQPVIEEHDYVLRQIFDIMFFIVVIIVLLNIIFGIIIDTFAELREKKKEVQQDNQSVCLICGNEKNEFERKGYGWTEHIQSEHNAWAYLAYIIYIKTKPASKCDGIEMYVQQKIKNNDVSFFPKTALSLEREEEEIEPK